jgi:hypothetical protein
LNALAHIALRVAAVSLLMAAAPVAPAAPADPAAQRKAYVAEELVAAKSESFYLVFDPIEPALDLKIEGVRVPRFRLERAEVGLPRLGGAGEPQWPAVAFALATKIPEPERPRIEVQKQAETDKAIDEAIKRAIARGTKPAGELSETAGEKVAKQVKPPDPEEPVNFELEFDPGLVLVVRGEPEPGDFASRLRGLRYAIVEGWQGVARSLSGKPRVTRLVVELPAQDARRLWKVFVYMPGLKLLVYAPPAP